MPDSSVRGPLRTSTVFLERIAKIAMELQNVDLLEMTAEVRGLFAEIQLKAIDLMEENNTLKARLKAITEAQVSKCPKCGTGDFVVTRKECLRA